MKIQLKVQVPVQKNLTTFKNHFTKKLKKYVEDLPNRGWIVPSESNYYSPAVALHKKDSALRSYCGSQVLNAKYYLDRDPLRNMQYTLAGLGGNIFFSVLDQSKAYHQLHMDEESRYLTAFITPWGWGLYQLGALFSHLDQCYGDYECLFSRYTQV